MSLSLPTSVTRIPDSNRDSFRLFLNFISIGYAVCPFVSGSFRSASRLRVMCRGSGLTLLVSSTMEFGRITLLAHFPVDEHWGASQRGLLSTEPCMSSAGLMGAFLSAKLRNRAADKWRVCISCFLLQFLKGHLEGRKARGSSTRPWKGLPQLRAVSGACRWCCP